MMCICGAERWLSGREVCARVSHTAPCVPARDAVTPTSERSAIARERTARRCEPLSVSEGLESLAAVVMDDLAPFAYVEKRLLTPSKLVWKRRMLPALAGFLTLAHLISRLRWLRAVDRWIAKSLIKGDPGFLCFHK